MADPPAPLSPRALRASPELEYLCSAWAQEVLGLRAHDPEENFSTPWGDLNALLGAHEKSQADLRLLALALAVGARSLIEERELTPKVTMQRFTALARAGSVNALPVLDEVFGEYSADFWQALPHTPVSGGSALLIAGELLAPPRSGLFTTLFAFSPFLLLRQSAMLIGRRGLGYRTPASLRVLDTGLELDYRREILGRVLTEVKLLVPTEELARVGREVRYQGTLLYAGLAALVIGSYFGFGLLLDGLRVPGGSLPLLATGVGVILAGLGLDFAAATGFDSIRGRDRLLITTRSGIAFALGDIAPADAEAFLRQYQLSDPAGNVD